MNMSDSTISPVFVVLRLTQPQQSHNAVLQLRDWLSGKPFELVNCYRAIEPDKPGGTERPPLRLSESDIALLRALAQGQTNKEIAHRENRSLNTIGSRLKRLFKKLGVRSRSEAVALGLRDRIL